MTSTSGLRDLKLGMLSGCSLLLHAYGVFSVDVKLKFDIVNLVLISKLLEHEPKMCLCVDTVLCVYYFTNNYKCIINVLPLTNRF